MDVQRKLEILADAAKYDASCASSGTEKRDSRDGKGIGSTDAGMGICHSYAPDGRCISALQAVSPASAIGSMSWRMTNFTLACFAPIATNREI